MDTKANRRAAQQARNASFLTMIAAAVSSVSSLFGEAFKGAGYTPSKSKRRHSSNSRYEGRKADSRRVTLHGSPERIGFPRSDDRHPKHPAHIQRFHSDGECNCVGRIHRRDVPARIGGHS